MNKRSDELMRVPNDRRIFSERLVARMRAVGITGAELARQSRLSKDAISTYTTMRSLPMPKTLDRLAKALKCKPDDLLPAHTPCDSFLELRDSSKPGHKILVAKLELPWYDALRAFDRLAKIEKRLLADEAAQRKP